MTDASGRDMWIEAGLKEIGRSGIEGVRVEVLAERLGITKGGFYRRFRNRRALLNSLLDTTEYKFVARCTRLMASSPRYRRNGNIKWAVGIQRKLGWDEEMVAVRSNKEMVKNSSLDTNRPIQVTDRATAAWYHSLHCMNDPNR